MSNIYKQILMENVLDIIKKRGFYYIRTMMQQAIELWKSIYRNKAPYMFTP